jgi:hypothetical protein
VTGWTGTGAESKNKIIIGFFGAVNFVFNFIVI